MSINLLPCPFCGHDSPEFERMGDRRQSCIVICGWCGARHESSDEGDRCGSSWNQRAEPGQDGLRTSLETALNRIEDMLSNDDGQAFKEARKFLPVGRAALAAQPGAEGEPLTDSFVQTVPDKCDRIVWRNSYYHLPLAAAPTEAKPAPAPGYCKHCKQYTIEEPLPAQQDAVDAERWNWLVGDCDGNEQDDFIQWLAHNVASKADINARADAAISAKKGGA